VRSQSRRLVTAAFATDAARSRSARSVPGRPVAVAANSANQPAPPAAACQLASWLATVWTCRVQAAPGPLGQRLAVARQRLRHYRQPPRDHRPVVRGVRGHQQERGTDLLVRAEDLGDEPEHLAGVADGQLGLQPLPQQPRASALVRVGEPAVRGLLEAAETREGAAPQVVERLLAARRQVRQPVLADGQAELGADQRIELGVRLHVLVGGGPDRAGGRGLTGGIWHASILPPGRPGVPAGTPFPRRARTLRSSGD
jgi:hypothetical protein